MDQVSVRVPATSANIGPGYDSLGCALSLYNDFTFSRAERTEVTGCPAAFQNENNLALVAFRRACAYRKADPCVVKLKIDAHVPVSRGLGSSATLIVAGIRAADALCALSLSPQEVFTLATGLEGHPDNVAPAVFGGFTASLTDENGTPHTVPCPVHPAFRFCAFIPDFETETHAARAVLPATVSHTDAAANAAHVAVLLGALRTGDTACLSLALRDRLHEPYRMPLIHHFADVRAAALAAGAHAFYLSGSGSTCMAIYTDDGFPARVAPAVGAIPHHWQVLPLSLDTQGARLLA